MYIRGVSYSDKIMYHWLKKCDEDSRDISNSILGMTFYWDSKHVVIKLVLFNDQFFSMINAQCILFGRCNKIVTVTIFQPVTYRPTQNSYPVKMFSCIMIVDIGLR